jgi:hypothetical protein
MRPGYRGDPFREGIRSRMSSGVSGGIEIVTAKMTPPAARMIVLIRAAGDAPGPAGRS